MSKPLKLLLLALVLVIATAAGALAYILLTIDPNDYKPELEQLAKAQGVELQIDGELGWTLLPRLALRVGPTKISGAEFNLNPSTIAGAQLSLEWLPLLRRQIVVNALDIDGADIHLVQNQQAAAALGTPLAAGETAASGAGSEPFALAFSRFELTNSRISVRDDGNGATVYDQINLAVQDLNTRGESFPIQLSLNYLTANDMSGDPAGQEKPLAITSAGDVAYNPETRQLAVDSLALEIRHLLADVIKVTLAGSVDLAADTASTRQLHIALGSLGAEGSLQMSGLSTAPSASGSVKISSSNLKGDLQSLTGRTFATENPQALTLFDLSLQYQASPEKVAINALQLTLDTTRLTGDGQLTLGDRRQLQLQLAGTDLNLDSYRAPQPDSAAATSSEAAPPDGEGALLAPLAGLLALLNGGNGDVRLSFDSLVMGETTFAKPSVRLVTHGSKLNLAPVRFGLYDGELEATAALDLGGDQAKIAFNLSADSVDLVAAQRQWAENANLEGRLTMKLAGTTQGNSGDELRNGLTAAGDLSVDGLHLASVNLEQSYCELAQLVEKNPPRETPWPKGTDLQTLTGQFTVQGQTIQLQHYQTGLGNLAVRGDGTIHLDAEKFAIKAITRLSGDRTSDTGCAVKSKRVRDRDIPLLCKDRFAKADAGSCKPDPDFVKQLVQKELLDKFIKPSGDGEEKPLEGLLKGLFNR